MKNDRGMTLIEVLIAFAISFVVFIGLSAAGVFVLNENIRNTMRDEAVSVAEMSMEAARNTVFDNLVAGSQADNVVRRVRGLSVPYTVTRTVTNIDPAGNNRQVVIQVAWSKTDQSGTRSYSHQVATIVRRR